MFPKIFWEIRVIQYFLPSCLISVPFPALLCLPLWPPSSFGLGHIVLYYCFLNSKNIDGKYELHLLGGGLWFLCPLESVGPLGLAWCGMSQWLSHCRRSARPLIPQSGFVESGRGPALSKLTPPTSLMQWNKNGLHLSSFVGGSLPLCAYRSHFRTCVSVLYVSGKVCDFWCRHSWSKVFFTVVSRTALGRPKGSVYPPGILMLYSRRDGAGPVCVGVVYVFYPSHSPLPQTAGFCKPLSSQKPPAYFCWVYERCEQNI